MSSDHIHFFLHLRDQLKLYHWQTRVYARHTASDRVLEDLEKTIDSFVEIYIGKYGRSRLTGNNAVVTLHNLTDAGATRFVKTCVRYVQGPLSRSLGQGDSDLKNLRDELLGHMNQLLYLFTLH